MSAGLRSPTDLGTPTLRMATATDIASLREVGGGELVLSAVAWGLVSYIYYS